MQNALAISLQPDVALHSSFDIEWSCPLCGSASNLDVSGNTALFEFGRMAEDAHHEQNSDCTSGRFDVVAPRLALTMRFRNGLVSLSRQD